MFVMKFGLCEIQFWWRVPWHVSFATSYANEFASLGTQKFCDIIKAALTANASASNGEAATILELIPERRVPLWSLNTMAIVPTDCAPMKAASTLHLIQLCKGGLQVKFGAIWQSLKQKGMELDFPPLGAKR
nr:uncharacterized protein LOC114924150 [Arachis hypogaea]